MAFEGLTEKLSNAFKKLRGKGRLSEADVKDAMREIRLALLEADVSYKVVKDFIKKTTERAVGTDVLESLTPAQMIVKIVNEEQMCIRDRYSACGGRGVGCPPRRAVCRDAERFVAAGVPRAGGRGHGPVSYTHLAMPSAEQSATQIASLAAARSM